MAEYVAAIKITEQEIVMLRFILAHYIAEIKKVEPESHAFAVHLKKILENRK